MSKKKALSYEHKDIGLNCCFTDKNSVKLLNGVLRDVMKCVHSLEVLFTSALARRYRGLICADTGRNQMKCWM